jgi:hypothetical protein
MSTQKNEIPAILGNVVGFEKATPAPAPAALPQPDQIPIIPPALTFSANSNLTFPVNDSEFHLTNVSKTESYHIVDELRIPIVDGAGGVSKFRGVALIGDNSMVLRNWFRNGKKGLLLWDYSHPLGSELGYYTRT